MRWVKCRRGHCVFIREGQCLPWSRKRTLVYFSPEISLCLHRLGISALSLSLTFSLLFFHPLSLLPASSGIRQYYSGQMGLATHSKLSSRDLYVCSMSHKLGRQMKSLLHMCVLLSSPLCHTSMLESDLIQRDQIPDSMKKLLKPLNVLLTFKGIWYIVLPCPETLFPNRQTEIRLRLERSCVVGSVLESCRRQGSKYSVSGSLYGPGIACNCI